MKKFKLILQECKANGFSLAEITEFVSKTFWAQTKEVFKLFETFKESFILVVSSLKESFIINKIYLFHVNPCKIFIILINIISMYYQDMVLNILAILVIMNTSVACK